LVEVRLKMFRKEQKNFYRCYGLCFKEIKERYD